MNYKFLIMLIISLKVNAQPLEKTVFLLDQLHEAQAYWEMMAQDKKLYFWNRPPNTWFTNKWKKNIVFHQKNLAKQRAELIKILATLSENQKSLSCKAFSKLKKQIHFVLAKHGAPSHFKRRWISYLGLATAAATLAFYVHKFKEENVLFIIPPQNNSLASSLENLYPFLGHKYVADQDGTQYLQVKKGEEEQAKNFLVNKNIIALKSAPHISLLWRNEQGENKVQEFIQKYGIRPIKNIYTILKNEDHPETKVFTTDIKQNEQIYETTLTKVLLNALKIDETKKIMHQTLKGKSVEALSLPEKQEVFLHLTAELPDIINTQINNIGTLIHTENQKTIAMKKESSLFTPIGDNPYLPEWVRKQIIDINLGKETANEGKELIREVQKYANVINHVAETTPGILGLIVQIVTTTGFELKLKEASFTHMAQTAIRDAQLNIELSKTIPLMLSAYLSYLGISSVYRKATALTIITPLKTDLLSLQLVLNKERYAKNCAAFSQDFKGECFYWIQRLNQYKEKLPSTYRATYRRYLHELEDKSLVPQQKMTLITCLFHELDPLFKKS